MNVIYSFNKTGYEGDCVEKEIAAASDSKFTFVPFNHVRYLDPNRYLEAAELDLLYRDRHPGLMRMYADFETLIRERRADAIIVDNCPPYHPDFLKNLSVYKVLYSSDDWISTYRRNIPYLHAYNHVFYCASGYSRDMEMHAKMRYCGMMNADWLPLGVFDFECDPTQTEETILSKKRDIDIVYVGAFQRPKIPILARLKRAFGRRLRMHGFFRLKHNLYFNIRYGFPGWIRPVSFEQRVQLYQRAKVGFNLHYNEYMLGNQRLYHLPANGVMQVCDCPTLLKRGQIYQEGEEIVAFHNADDLIDQLRYYLGHDDERQAIAQRAYRRVMRDYRRGPLMRHAGQLILQGMERNGVEVKMASRFMIR